MTNITLSDIEKCDTIDELLRKKGLTRTNLAEKMGFKSRNTMYGKLNDISLLSVAELVKMSDIFQVQFIDMCQLVDRQLTKIKQSL